MTHNSLQDPAEKVLVHAPAPLSALVVQTYVDRTAAVVPEIQHGLAAGNLDQARIFGHRLKGTGGAYGMPALSEVGAAIEQAALRADYAEISDSLAALAVLLERIEVA